MRRRRARASPPATERRPGRLHALASPLGAIHRRVFCHEIDPFVLGVYRIALGLFILLYLALIAPHWETYFGPAAISPYTGQIDGYRFFDPILMHIGSESTLWAIYGVSVAAAALVVAGVGSRFALIWLLILNHSLLYASVFVVNGEEQVLGVLLLLSIFLPLDRAITLPQLLSRRRRAAILDADAKVTTWALVPLQAHIALIYLYGLPLKLLDDAWQSGHVVYYAMMALDYPRFPGLGIFAWGDAIVSRVLTYATLVAELLVPLLIWFRRWRVWCVAVAVMMHVGLGFLLEGVMMFNAAMIVAWLVFLPSRRSREWLARRLRRR